MRTFVSQGDVVELTAPGGGVTVGQGYVFGSGTPKLFAIATVTAAAAAKFNGVVEGVVEVAKEATAAAFSEGDPVFWDDTNKRVDESAAGRYQIGVAVQTVLAAATTVKVKLDGQPVSPVV